MVSHHLGHAIGALENIGIRDEQEHAFGRTFHQSARGFEHGDAGAFRSHQRARHMETVFRKEVIQVVAGYPTRNIGIASLDKFAVCVAQLLQSGINFAATTALGDDVLQFRITGLAHLHAQAVVGKDLQFLDVVIGLARHHRVNAAGVVSDHAAQRASIMGCGIGTERQMMFFCRVAQMIENDSRLNSGNSPRRIDLEDIRHVLAEIEHYGDVAALSGERGSAAAAENGRAIFASQRDSREDIVDIARNNYSDRNLAVVGPIGGVEGAAAVVKAHFPAQRASESRGKCTCIDCGRFGSAGEFGEVPLHINGG